MKESKALVYLTRRNIQIDLDRDYTVLTNELGRYRYPSLRSSRYEKSQDVGSQYDYKRDNLACTCRALNSIKKRRDVKHFGSPKQVYAYHERSRSFTDVGIGSVKALLKKKVQRVYLPATDDKGCGSSDWSSYLRSARQHETSSYYATKKTSSKCVGGTLAYNTGSVMSAKLSPIIHTVSGSTSPQEPENRNKEIGSNTVIKMVTNNTTQVEQLIDKEIDSQMGSNEESKLEERQSQEDKVKVPINNTGEISDSNATKDRKYKPLEKYSSDSLVQHVHDLEKNPSDEVEKQSRCSDDLMENKLEREYRKMFATKSKDSKKSSNDRRLPDNKSASVLKRRFEALRRGLARKDDSKRSAVITSKISSQVSMTATSHRDVSINSDPPSLEARSFSNTKIYSPHAFASIVEHDKSNIYNPQPSYKRTDNRQQKASVSWSKTDEEDSECQGVKGMFKLWGKKFNLEEEAYKSSTVPKTSFAMPKIASEKKEELPKMPTKPSVDEKEKKKFFFFKKKNKDEKKDKPFNKPKKDVTTAGRCEVKEGLMIKIGNVDHGHKTKDEETTKKPAVKKEVYDEETGHATWLQKYLSRAIESRNSVKVRWNNKMYGTSSSTVFELMDNVYRDTGIIFRSKSEMTVQSSHYKPYSRRHNVNFAQQNIEAWMIRKMVTDHPQQLPVKTKHETKKTNNENMEVRISDHKWFIDKSKAFSHKIEVVLLSKNLVRCNRKESSEYLRIDIPKGFFVNSSDISDDTTTKQNQSSDEEVYKIIEYETGSDLKKERTCYRPDKEHKNIKLTLSVRSHSFERNVLETVIKTPPTLRDVVIQGSKVLIPNKCDVVGVGIITHREMKKPILTIQDAMTDDDSEIDIRLHLKKCEFAESYLQEYYRRWAPIPGIDMYSWCVRDSHSRCLSEPSKTSMHNESYRSKSCPNILEDYQAFVSSCETSQTSCRKQYVDREAAPCISPPRWYQKIKPLDKLCGQNDPLCSKSNKKTKTNACIRTMPKDSLEVVKRRKIYAASMKSQWRTNPCENPYSMPSADSKAAGLECTSPKVSEATGKPCSKSSVKYTKKSECQPKHVSLPNCEEMANLIKQQLNCPPEGILAFKGASGSDVKKQTRCKVDPVCEILPPPCQAVCEKMKKPFCRNSKIPCDEPPPCPPSASVSPPYQPPCPPPEPPCSTPPKPPCTPPPQAPSTPPPKPPCSPPPKPPCSPPPKPPCSPPPKPPCTPPPKSPCPSPPKQSCSPPPKQPCSPPKPPCSPPPSTPPPMPPCSLPPKPPCSPPSKRPSTPRPKRPCSPSSKRPRTPCSNSPRSKSSNHPTCSPPRSPRSPPRSPCSPPRSPRSPPRSPSSCPSLTIRQDSPPGSPALYIPSAERHTQSKPKTPPCQKPRPPPCQKPPPPCQKPQPPPYLKSPLPCKKPPPPCQKSPPCTCSVVTSSASSPSCPGTPQKCPSTPEICLATPCSLPPCQKPPPCSCSPKRGRTPPRCPNSPAAHKKLTSSILKCLGSCSKCLPRCPNSPAKCVCSHQKTPCKCCSKGRNTPSNFCCVRDPLQCPASPPSFGKNKTKKKKRKSCSTGSSSSSPLLPKFRSRNSTCKPPPKTCSPAYSVTSDAYSYSSVNQDIEPTVPYQYSSIHPCPPDYCDREENAKHSNKRICDPPTYDMKFISPPSMQMHPCDQCRPSYDEFPRLKKHPQCDSSCVNMPGSMLSTSAAKRCNKPSCPNHPSNVLPTCQQPQQMECPPAPKPCSLRQTPPPPKRNQYSPPQTPPPSKRYQCSPPQTPPPPKRNPCSPPQTPPPSKRNPCSPPHTPPPLKRIPCSPPHTPPPPKRNPCSPPQTPPPLKRIPCSPPHTPPPPKRNPCSPPHTPPPPKRNPCSPPQTPPPLKRIPCSPPHTPPPQKRIPCSEPQTRPPPKRTQSSSQNVPPYSYCPGATESKSKPKLTGVHLRISPPRKQENDPDCKPCSGSQNLDQGDDCIELSSEDKIFIRLKKETPSTEEIREGLNIKVQNEDGVTLYERKDYVRSSEYRRQNPSHEQHKSRVLGDVYKNSYVQRMAAPVAGQTESNKEILTESHASIANTIEIQFKVKVTQGDHATEINIANEDNKKSDIVLKDRKNNKAAQDVFVLNDKGRSDDKSEATNDINIRIVIKNFKPKSDKTKHENRDNYCNEFSKEISSKFHSVSTGYSDVESGNVDHVFSIHRATVDLTSSVEKSMSQSRQSEETMSESITDQETDKIVVSSRVTEESICICMAGDRLPTIGNGEMQIGHSCISKKKISLRGIQVKKQDTDFEKSETDIEITETDTEKPETDREKLETYGEKPETDAEKTGTDIERLETDTDKPTTDTEKLETDTDKTETDAEKRETDYDKTGTDTNKIDTDTDKLETDTDRLETDTEKLVTDTEKRETDTERPETDTDKRETDNERPETDTDKRETDTERPETDTEKSDTDTEKPETDIEKLETDNEKPESDTEKQETDTEKPETDTEKVETNTNKPETDAGKKITDNEKQDHKKQSDKTFEPIVYTDIDEPNTDSLEIIKRPRTKEEKKEIMKNVFEKARDVKKNKTRMKKLRDMLKVILTSDSSEPDEVKMDTDSKNLAKDITYASLGPNYYAVENNLAVSDKDIKPDNYETEDNSVCSKSSTVTSDNDTPIGNGCMCNTVAERLRKASRMRNLGRGCCCGQPKSKIIKNEQVCCDVKHDSVQEDDCSLEEEIEPEYVDVETQNSRYLTSKVTSTDTLVENSLNSNLIRLSIGSQKKDSSKFKTPLLKFSDNSNKYLKQFSPRTSNMGQCEMRKLNRNTILSISGESKIVVLSAKPTKTASEASNARNMNKKTKIDEHKSSVEAADILQSYETKKAVLEIYTERSVSTKGERLVAKLPKFVYDTESEIYNAISTNTYMCKNNVIMMTINR